MSSLNLKRMKTAPMMKMWIEDISGVPEVGSIWNDCIVAASNKSSDGSGTDLLLMSLEEWESQIATARSVPEGYSVHNIKNWRFLRNRKPKQLETGLMVTD